MKSTQIKFVYVSAILALTGSSCGVSNYGFDANPAGLAQVNPTGAPTPTPPPNTPGPSPMAGVDNFAPPAVVSTKKLDIVLIVDNSGSMADNQARLISALDDFIDGFALTGADWRISLLSTDVSNGFGGNCYSSYAAPKAAGNWLSKYAGVPWLGCNSSGCNVADLNDAIAKFKANVALGTCGSGDERGIDSLMLATDAAHLMGANSGFFRADSYKAVFVISDENHGNLDGVGASSLNLISNSIARMQSLGTGGYGFYFVNDMTATPANNTDGNGINEYPAFYLKMANDTGSLMLDIKAPDWEDQLIQVGASIITQAQKEFKLSRVPIANSIVVKIDNVVVMQDAANGWQYHAAPQNSIELYGAAKAAAAGHALKVEYMYNP